MKTSKTLQIWAIVINNNHFVTNNTSNSHLPQLLFESGNHPS